MYTRQSAHLSTVISFLWQCAVYQGRVGLGVGLSLRLPTSCVTHGGRGMCLLYLNRAPPDGNIFVFCI